jgi:hypothetical protein
MFSELTVQIISSLRFDPNAQTVYCLLPLGSIFWSDELPQLKFLAFGDDHDKIMRLFAIRINYWETNEIPAADLSVWEHAQREFPEWPFFRRLALTSAQLQQHKNAQQQMENLFDELTELGDDFVVSEGPDGFDSFSATFNVSDE